MLRTTLLILLCLCGASITARAGIVARIEAMPPADVVLLGEVHDNPEHHLNQARIISALRPAALVFEMLTPEQAGRIAIANRHDSAALAAALDWNAGAWPDFSIYFPIFAAAGNAAIIGGGLPRSEVRRAIGDGAPAVFGAEAGKFGLDVALSPQMRSAREADLMAAHCDALPVDLVKGMIEAQRLRDAALARAALSALEQTGGPVAVITGNGHARRDWGVPSLLAIAAPETRVLSVGQYELEAPDQPPFDLVVVTETVEREDPCRVFQGK